MALLLCVKPPAQPELPPCTREMMSSTAMVFPLPSTIKRITALVYFPKRSNDWLVSSTDEIWYKVCVLSHQICLPHFYLAWLTSRTRQKDQGLERGSPSVLEQTWGGQPDQHGRGRGWEMDDSFFHLLIHMSKVSSVPVIYHIV